MAVTEAVNTDAGNEIQLDASISQFDVRTITEAGGQIRPKRGAASRCPQAIEHKLVDEEGYLDQAIARAGALAGIAASVEPQVNLIEGRGGGLVSALLGRRSEPVSVDIGDLRDLLTELSVPRLEYRTPIVQP